MSGLLDFADTLLSLGEEEYGGNTRDPEEEGWNVDEGEDCAGPVGQSYDTGTNDGPPQHTKFGHSVANRSNSTDEAEGCEKVYNRVNRVSDEAKDKPKNTNTFSHGSSIDNRNAIKPMAAERQNVSKQASTVLLVDDLLSSLYLPQTRTTAHRTIKSLREHRKDTETSGKIQRSTLSQEGCVDDKRTGDKGNTKTNNDKKNSFEQNAESDNSNNNRYRDSGNNKNNSTRNDYENRCDDTDVIKNNNEAAKNMEKETKLEEELRQKKQRDVEEKVIQLRIEFDRLWSDWKKSIDNPNERAKLSIKDILEFGETLRRDYMKRTLRISNSARAQLNAKVMEQKIAQVFGLLSRDHPTTALHTENQGKGPKYTRTRKENLYIKFMLQKELSSLPEYKPKPGKARSSRAKETNQEQQKRDGSHSKSPTNLPVSPSKRQAPHSPLRATHRVRMTENVQQKEKVRAEELEKMAIEIETMLESMQETEEEALERGNSEVDDKAGQRGRGNVEPQHSNAPSLTSEAMIQIAKDQGTAQPPSYTFSTPSSSTRSTSSSASLSSSPALAAPPSYPPPNGVGRSSIPRGPNSTSFTPPSYKSPSSVPPPSSSSSSSPNTTERLQKLLALRQLLALPAARLRHLPAVQRELVSRCRPYTQYLNMSEGEVRQLPMAQQRAVEELYSVLGLDMEN